MQTGARGVAVGRNITQSRNPIGTVAALNALVHNNANADEAFAIYKKYERNSVKEG